MKNIRAIFYASIIILPFFANAFIGDDEVIFMPKDPKCKVAESPLDLCVRSDIGKPYNCKTKENLPPHITEEMQEAVKHPRCTEYFAVDTQGDDMHENLTVDPVPMDEAGEIKPVREFGATAEIIEDSLAEYSINEKDLAHIDLEDGFYRYDDGTLVLNIKNGDVFKDKIHIKGYIDSSTRSRWGVFESQFGILQLKTAGFEVLKTVPLSVKDNWLSLANKHKKIWFNVEINIKDLDAGSYLLEFQNTNPSGLEKNMASFVINIRIKKDQQKPSIETRILKKYPSYHIKLYDKERGEVLIERVVKGRLLWLIPFSYEEEILLDDKALFVKDLKSPWWSFLLF